MSIELKRLSVFFVIIMLSFGQYATAAEGLSDEQIVEKARGNISADMWAIQPDETATDRDFPYFPCFFGQIDWSKGKIERVNERVSYELDITGNVLQTFVSKESLAEYKRTNDARYVYNSVHYIYEADRDGKNEAGVIMVVVPSKEYADSGRLGMECTDWNIEPNFSGHILYLFTSGLFYYGNEYRDGKIVAKVVSKSEGAYVSRGKNNEKLRLERHLGKISVTSGADGEVAVTTSKYNTMAGTCFVMNDENALPYKKTLKEGGGVIYESIQDSLTSQMQVYYNDSMPWLFGTCVEESYCTKAVKAIRKYGLSDKQIQELDSLKRPMGGCHVNLYFDKYRKLRRVTLWVHEGANKIIESEPNGVARLWKAVCSVRLPAFPHKIAKSDKYLFHRILPIKQVGANISDADIEATLPVIVPVK